MKKNSTISIIILIAFIIFIIYSIGSTYQKLAPKLDSIFEIGERLENEQVIEDSVFKIYNLSKKEYTTIDLKESAVFYFVNPKTFDLDITKDINKIETKLKNKLYLIVDDTTNFSLDFNNKRAIEKYLYYSDSINYPFKIKHIIYPYVLHIDDYIVKRSYVGNINTLE